MIILAGALSQIVLLVVAVIVFVILAVISGLILYRYIKENNTFVLKEGNKKNKEILDLSQEIGNDDSTTSNGLERFSKLMMIDAKKRNPVKFEDVSSLKVFCDDFRR